MTRVRLMLIAYRERAGGGGGAVSEGHSRRLPSRPHSHHRDSPTGRADRDSKSDVRRFRGVCPTPSEGRRRHDGP
jgi:hypothetical protein